ncbi:hypothetical protein ACFFSW_17500 [Saccharothrix longispora]|uniref:DNA-binding transcriptional MocR family regulator n=1 Tax=Saccharothrix longispora TaxID=33920 RepID=A0ABU1PPK1_9PSEU|nr:hypothetical protein [Saccharothrix longispora]MDR6592597.1 DNA-binding transcriptional MocR family regulator [Saccharothrix longispora]
MARRGCAEGKRPRALHVVPNVAEPSGTWMAAPARRGLLDEPRPR